MIEAEDPKTHGGTRFVYIPTNVKSSKNTKNMDFINIDNDLFLGKSEVSVNSHEQKLKH